jgi:SpoVK/Ycf46/Vps4 family AAA+-type ATPase
MQCEKCKTENRSIASFCKRCGTTITQAVAAVSLGCSIDELVGLDEIKKELQKLQAILEGMKEQGSKSRYPFNTILIGNSGTAKTLISNLIADMFLQFGITTKNKPVTIDGGALGGEKALKAAFDSAKGGMLFIDDAQRLVDGEGNASDSFHTLTNVMDQYKDDPIVLLAGLPFGLREFIKNPKNKKNTGRFQKFFIISDYSPDQYTAIAESIIKKKGYTLADAASEKMLKRFRWLYKDLKKADTSINAANGYLATNEAWEYIGSYNVRRKASNNAISDKIILPEDITGQIEEKKSLEEIMAELDSIIGMTELKKEIKSLYTHVQQQVELAKIGGKSEKPSNHFVITGNPGTGKTTVARMLGKIFEGIGLLGAGHVIEVDRSKMVVGYVGQTAPNVNKLCDDAMGGILFIDEVYTLKQNDSDATGQEAIDTLLKRMEDDRDKLMVVVAGYKDKMAQFITSNAGLESRFTKKFHIEDYTPEELTEIFMSFAKKDGIIVPDGTKDKVTAFFKDRCARKTKDFANAREARKLISEALKNKAQRIEDEGGVAALSRDDALTLLPQDIPATASEKAVTIEEALKELNKLVGLKSVKDMVVKISNTLRAQKLTGDTETLSKHFVFTGNPGTGKTTVARILANVFNAVGMLPTNTLVEADRSKLVASYVGQTSPLVNAKCDDAMGGILFIDEAYTLQQGQQDSFGQEAVDTLLKRMEDDRGKYVVIAAGYSKEMEEFLQTNTGFKSRFSDTIHFEDYTPDEMYEIFINMCKKKKLEFADGTGGADGADAALKKRLKDIYGSRGKDFANARTVRQLYDKVYENISSRVMAMEGTGASEEEMRKEMYILRAEDIPGVVAEKEVSLEDALKELNEMIGLKSVKDSVTSIANTLKAQKFSGQTEKMEKHFVFQGSPGTGKTTVARIMGNVFKALGMLPTNKVVEVERSKLVGEYMGHTAKITNKVCDSAAGGILFVDEAYALKQRKDDSFGQEAVDTLLKRMEDDRGKYVVIAAGYTKEMGEFLASNSGFKSRFTDYINFEDYTAAEMREIFISMCKKDKREFADGFDDALKKRLEDLYSKRDKQFANARIVRQIYKKTYENVSSRVVKMEADGASEDECKREIFILRPEDLDMSIS